MVRAREVQMERGHSNALMLARLIRRQCALDETGERTLEMGMCQYRLKITHSAGRKRYHPPEKMVYSFSRLVKNRTGW